ncbi:hypothetical protein Rhe02_94590 [Rhizocola hellebori]|uniref:DUF3558 domain-containing protein n=1 Tax=Rhizocola hellebori TaxID=1392758 RepID=A0A8J3QKQ2_9ACTN|nr:hypothetical protein [Rhizocola hellebori]GIH11392.1 hypothetical protein Rhe02_94590 [Rhizocola hellebori]
MKAFPAKAAAKTALATAAVALALISSGCTASGEPDTSPPLPDTTDSTSDGGLGVKLLTESDLPPGFSEVQLPTVKGGMGALIGCPALDVRPSEQVGEASVSFAGGTAGSLITESIRMVTAAQSRQALEDLAAVPKQCSNAKTASVSTMGTQSTAIRVTATPPELGIGIDGYIVGIRDEQTVVVVVFVSPGTADPAAAEAVAKTAWEKASLQ